MNKERIAVIGVGKLGLCLALLLEKAGYHVLGYDQHPGYSAQISAKTLRSPEPGLTELLAASKDFQLFASIPEIVAQGPKMIFIVVATPSLPNGGYDHSQVDDVLDKIAASGPAASPTDLVIVCTTMPGYTEKAAEKMHHLGFFLSYNPEFIAQGSILRDIQQPDQVLIGEADEAAGNRIQAVWERLVTRTPTFCRMRPLSAEITKIATNCFLTTKISFANSIGDLATQVGAEPDKILAAIGSDSRIGAKYLNYGFGYGGPCFPRDNRALGKFADESGYELLLSKATDEVNRRHLQFQLAQYLQEYAPHETIVFETVTYKKGTEILEESQQLALAVALAQSGRKVLIRDNQAVLDELERDYPGLFELELLGE